MDENTYTEPFSYETQQLLTRWYRLRKLGRLFPLIQKWNKLYRFNVVERWNNLEEITLEKLREIVEQEEVICTVLGIIRKPINREEGDGIGTDSNVNRAS
jgi:hypothetical protein